MSTFPPGKMPRLSFSEEAPFGVVGSYLLDRQSEAPEHFSYKHHYLLHTLDTQILFDALCAMKEKTMHRYR